ncbi:MAG: HAD family hydrolase [Candidatus Pacebacteria bacterium]|nr:HAD family hydrolase [Candidatus Paceibacterota bacterium]
MQKIKVVILDFDNTLILDEVTGRGSEDKKVEVWYQVFSEIPADRLATLMIDLQKQIAGGRGDRKDIVRALCREIGVTDEMLEAECGVREYAFDEQVQKGVLEVGMSDENKQALRALATQYSLYLNSATPLEALERSLKALGIRDAFVQVYGRPGTKEENLHAIVAHSGVNVDNMLFVDDQPKAGEIARTVGCQFIGMRTAGVTTWPEGIQTACSIRELVKVLGVKVEV